MSEFFNPSDLAFFHNQKNGEILESFIADFNSGYADSSREKEIPYSSETVITAFEPVIETLKSRVTSLSGVNILEIGGSTGLFSKYLQDQGAAVTMLETQPTFVNQAKNRGVNARLYNGSNLFSTISSSTKFNVIIANRVFEDIVMPEYLAKNLIKQSLSLLIPRGFFLVGSQNPSAIWNYSFLCNGFQPIESRQTPYNNYLKEARIYQQSGKNL